MPNTHRRRRRDATVELSRVGVGGALGFSARTPVGLGLHKQRSSKKSNRFFLLPWICLFQAIHNIC